MRAFLLALLVTLFVPAVAVAQNENLDIVQDPFCFAVVNTSEHMVMGNLATNYYTSPDGIQARHRSNFRLQAAGSTDADSGHATDREEFCSYGPFLPNRMLTLTLRTLFPIFECETRVDTGQEIVIKSVRREDDSGVQTWAECIQVDGTKSGRPPLR